MPLMDEFCMGCYDELNLDEYHECPFCGNLFCPDCSCEECENEEEL